METGVPVLPWTFRDDDGGLTGGRVHIALFEPWVERLRASDVGPVDGRLSDRVTIVGSNTAAVVFELDRPRRAALPHQNVELLNATAGRPSGGELPPPHRTSSLSTPATTIAISPARTSASSFASGNGTRA